MRKAALHNLGCKVNAYETEAMRSLLVKAGYEIVPFSEKADVYVINTCTVTNVADRKSRQMIHRARNLNPDAVVVAAGCYVQANQSDCGADILIGTDKKQALIPLLDECFSRRKMGGGRSDEQTVGPICAWADISGCSAEFEDGISSTSVGVDRAFVKIQDGCNRFCSYCIIPYVRGRARSRSKESILSEVRSLAERGCFEIVLTGIHLSSYGMDLPDEDEKCAEESGGCVKRTPEGYRPDRLLSLIAQICEVPGIRRVRLGSLEPTIITEDFAAALSSMPKVCPHFHLSLQSGCDAVLRRMNRHYDTADYERRCALLRRVYDDPAITTDVIVGFPGETEEEFAQTAAFVQKIHFYEMHVFSYSPREGTAAAKMPDQVPDAVKSERSRVLLSLSRQMSRNYRLAQTGRETSLLPEKEITIGGCSYFVGFTPRYVKAAVRRADCPFALYLTGRIGEPLSEDVMAFVPDDGTPAKDT